jgi:hypothetical protein
MSMTELLTPGSAARFMKSRRKGKRLHPSTIARWIRLGARRSDGSRIKLKAIRQGGGWFTSEHWLDEFLDALTRDQAGVPNSPIGMGQARESRQALTAESTVM